MTIRKIGVLDLWFLVIVTVRYSFISAVIDD